VIRISLVSKKQNKKGLHFQVCPNTFKFARISSKRGREAVVPPSSGIARVPCALEQEIFLRPSSTKLTEFELKDRCKSAEEVKAEHLL